MKEVWRSYKDVAWDNIECSFNHLEQKKYKMRVSSFFILLLLLLWLLLLLLLWCWIIIWWFVIINCMLQMCLWQTTKMKPTEILLLVLCLNIVTLGVIGNPPTCPADLETACGDSGEWKGEFFPGIPKIKYEVGQSLLFFENSHTNGQFSGLEKNLPVDAILNSDLHQLH